MYSEELENLMEIALADGELTEKRKQILFKRAQSEGIDLDEFEMVLDARLLKIQKEKGASVPQNEILTTPLAPQSNKYGEIQKCPACGATHVAGSAVCPECGYAFSTTGATKSSQLLYDMLMNASKDVRSSRSTKKNSLLKGGVFGLIYGDHSDDYDEVNEIRSRKMDIIQNFPVPNNREDLFDFLTSIQPKANPRGPQDGIHRGNENLSYYYWLLYSNCINKAKVSFEKDPSFASFFEFFVRNGGKL